MGWLGNIFIVFGLWYIGNQKRWAFLLTTVGEIIWVLHSYLGGQTDLMVICALFAILQFRSWLKFKQPLPAPRAEDEADWEQADRAWRNDLARQTA